MEVAEGGPGGAVLKFLVMTKLGVYIQVPFCQTKCTYCNFHTGVVSTGRFAPYSEAVCREIQGHRELYRAAGVELPEGFERAVVDTVYFGGGTPSLLEPELLQGMMDAIRGTFATALSEVTLEADPETVEGGKAAAWVRAGINRVSFGLQSFSDKELVAAGRMHRRADIYRAVPMLREAGIRNFSSD
jgi:oxygen-independent coproporphyrinogen-3 oxidase